MTLDEGSWMRDNPPRVPKRSHRRLVTKTGISSGLTGLVEYLLYLILVEVLGVEYYVQSSIAAGVFGLFFNFTLTRWWAFHDAHGSILLQFARYAVTTAVGIGAGASILYLLVDIFGIPYWIGWAIANLGVFAVWTYPSNWFWVFPARIRSEDQNR